MKRNILCMLLISSMGQFHAFNNNWFDDAMRSMRETMREMEENFSHMQATFAQTFQHQPLHKAEPITAPHISDHIVHSNDTTQLYVDNVEQGDISAEFSDNMLVIKHPHFSIHIKPVKHGTKTMLMMQLDVEQKEESTKDQYTSQSFYRSSHVETIPLEHTVDLEHAGITYDETTKRVIITLPYKQKKQIQIEVTRSNS